MTAKIGVQLYSVRNEMNEDCEAVIGGIAEMGYAGVELAGAPRGMSYPQLAKVIREAGLTVSSAHMPAPITKNSRFTFENLAELGTNRLVTGKMAADFNSLDSIKRSCDEFNRAAEEAEKAGVELFIHNHWWEFQNLGDEPIYKIMLRHLSEKVKFEIDTYWVTVAGKDATSIVEELAPRAPLLHMKDGDGAQGHLNMVALGAGIMDFTPIVQASKGSAEWLIVEFDDCATDIFKAFETSHAHLSSMMFA